MSQPRQRLNSMSDHSSPSSEASDNFETFDVCDLRLDNMNLETSLGTEVSEVERQQIESFLSGLGTEVSSRERLPASCNHMFESHTFFYEVRSLPSATIALHIDIVWETTTVRLDESSTSISTLFESCDYMMTMPCGCLMRDKNWKKRYNSKEARIESARRWRRSRCNVENVIV